MAVSGSVGMAVVIADPTTPSTQAAVSSTGLKIDASATSFLTVAYKSAVTLTRPADTAAYAANDVIGAATGSTAAIEFASIGPNAGHIRLSSVALRIDATALIASEAGYTLHFYSVTPPSALGDNAAFDLPSGDRASYLGKIALGTPVDLGSTLWIETHNINKQLTLAGTSLFAYLVTDAGYTPTSARVHVITLHAVSL